MSLTSKNNERSCGQPQRLRIRAVQLLPYGLPGPLRNVAEGSFWGWRC